LVLDKWRTKLIAHGIGIPTTWTVIIENQRPDEGYVEALAKNCWPVMCKPLKQGSSVGAFVGEIGQGFATVTVLVQQPPVKHEVKMRTLSHGSDAKDALPQRSF
jgi:D-alanine-D-alanine ligase-like ATP-grasp enzyme